MANQFLILVATKWTFFTSSLTPEQKFWQMVDRVFRGSTERLAVILVTQPFQVSLAVLVRSFASSWAPLWAPREKS